jgi:protein-S-isoprenylcysteine O-methyltransferase Ste14
MDLGPALRNHAVMRQVDVPPLWLLLFLVLAWIVARLDPWSLSLGGVGLQRLLAGLLVGGGALLIAVAVVQMHQHRTPVIPRKRATRLVETGIFRRTRNPIYLGMALILLGWILRLDAPLALPLLPLFIWVIERRFIRGEEAGLARHFPKDWERYRQATRRWL